MTPLAEGAVQEFQTALTQAVLPSQGMKSTGSTNEMTNLEQNSYKYRQQLHEDRHTDSDQLYNKLNRISVENHIENEQDTDNRQILLETLTFLA